MFTIEDVKAAHSKVRTGADFPAYIQDIIKLGVTRYETFVADGHAEFYGTNGETAQWEAKYAAKQIADESDKEQFIQDLRSHQQGNTDYMRYCSDSAMSGIEKWVVELEKMTCTYYDKAGNEILVEQIPG